MSSEALTQQIPQAPGVDEMSATELLAAARESRRAADAEEARLLVLAAQWAYLHPAREPGDEAGFHTPGFEHDEPIAGQGCPLVAEFCVAELGSVLGMSTTAAKRLIGNALELQHRLPRLWRRVQAGQVAPWRARRIAEATSHASPSLPLDAAKWVDAQVAAFAGRIGTAQLDRTVAEAMKRWELGQPEQQEFDEDGIPVADRRHVRIDTDQLAYEGTCEIRGEIDLADAVDLDTTLSRKAAEAKALGSPDTLDVRRAKALGELARTQTSLDLLGDSPDASDPVVEEGALAPVSKPGNRSGVRLPMARELVFHLHFDTTTGPDGTTLIDPTGRLEEGARLLLLSQVKTWCRDSFTRVSIRPVIDTAAELTTTSYVPTDTQREQIILRDEHCLFPWCSRPARRCDLDHVIPFDPDAQAEGRPQPGPTTSANLAALCRRHHRLKTHSAWRVEALAAGVLHWRSPHGHHYLVDRTGTTALEADPPGPPESRLRSTTRASTHSTDDAPGSRLRSTNQACSTDNCTSTDPPRRR